MARAVTPSDRERHRVFFIFAALDAILCVGIWLPAGLGIEQVWGSPPSVRSLHAQGLLFGVVPATMTGFLLTALPRWTGRQPISRPAAILLFWFWFAGRAAFFLLPAAAGSVSAAFIALLALIVAREVAAAEDLRNVKIALLLGALSIGAGMVGVSADRGFAEPGLRISVAAILGLIVVLGGRVVPSLTAHHFEMRGEKSPIVRRQWIERASAVATALALCAWMIAPYEATTGVACAFAAVGQAARLVQWHSWRMVAHLPVLVLHLAYGWVSIGFAFFAVHILCPGTISRVTALHAWAVGAIGLMSLAIMASMTRKQSGAALRPSRMMSLSYVCGLVAVVTRISAAAFPAQWIWLLLSTTTWIMSFALFLIVFRRALFGDLASRRGLTPVPEGQDSVLKSGCEKGCLHKR
ncbi:NnrS family protein [Microvirga brassicacearum]|uniref:NnrS family protein n=1 Tax=Microvirga brassicacearum TaxID=2580413 RepID=A0A5N3PAU3_9HYPH|nr:NnrS family protein [Microvirga brassicacearum]KAB0266857.1 NnrS family protein [Microvirga brassicacearum]